MQVQQNFGTTAGNRQCIIVPNMQCPTRLVSVSHAIRRLGYDLTAGCGGKFCSNAAFARSLDVSGHVAAAHRLHQPPACPAGTSRIKAWSKVKLCRSRVCIAYPLYRPRCLRPGWTPMHRRRPYRHPASERHVRKCRGVDGGDQRTAKSRCGAHSPCMVSTTFDQTSCPLCKRRHRRLRLAPQASG